MDIQSLVIRACKLGAKGMQVVGWYPPKTVTEDPNGYMIYYVGKPQTSPSCIPWYDN